MGVSPILSLRRQACCHGAADQRAAPQQSVRWPATGRAFALF